MNTEEKWASNNNLTYDSGSCTYHYGGYQVWPLTSSSCYVYYSPIASKFDTAFSIAKKLIDKKIVNIGNDLKKFMELIDSIKECI